MHLLLFKSTFEGDELYMKDQFTRIVRYKDKENNIHYGKIENGEIKQLIGDFDTIANGEWNEAGITIRLSDIELLVPVIPKKIINFGWTYVAHATETGGKPYLKEPLFFLKPTTTLIPHHDKVVLPPESLTSQVELEGELAIIIGKRGRNISEEEALDYVLGCTIINDVTARDLTTNDPQYTRGKGFDTFAPLGPNITLGLNPTKLNIKTKLNDTVVQQGNTCEMTLNIPFLISWVSQIMTLEPGDVLATGSPGGSCLIKSGDIIEIEVEEIGTLSNQVV